MIEWKSDLATDQQRSVLATFDTLLDQLERDFPETYDILRVLSFLDPEDVPLAMLTDGAQILSSPPDQPPGNSKRESSIITRIAKWTSIQRSSQRRSRNYTREPLPELHSLTSLILSPTAFPKARQKLQSLSLIELSRDGQSSLRMHDLVRFLTREHVKRRTAYQAWLDSAVSLICSALRRVEDPSLPQSWPEFEKLMPHVRSLWTSVQGVNLELVDADVRLARYLNSRGRYDDAERLCEHSIGSLQKELGEKHEDTLAALYVLADVYDSQGRFAEAERVLKQVLAVRKKELGTHHEDTLETTRSLAQVYYRQCRYKEAEELYKRTLAVEKKTLGPNHLETLKTMKNLALCYDSQQRYDEAEKLFKHVLAYEETSLGPDHVGTLATVHNLALVYHHQSKYLDAEELYERVLVSSEKQLGPSHPVTLTTVFNLAHIYQSQARNDEAERFYLRAFTGQKQLMGAKHPDTLEFAEDLADLYRSQGRNSEADALLETLGG
jgi:tetratricopeptide (TPR) repeat protein